MVGKRTKLKRFKLKLTRDELSPEWDLSCEERLKVFLFIDYRSNKHLEALDKILFCQKLLLLLSTTRTICSFLTVLSSMRYKSSVVATFGFGTIISLNCSSAVLFKFRASIQSVNKVISNFGSKRN